MTTADPDVRHWGRLTAVALAASHLPNSPLDRACFTNESALRSILSDLLEGVPCHEDVDLKTAARLALAKRPEGLARRELRRAVELATSEAALETIQSGVPCPIRMRHLGRALTSAPNMQTPASVSLNSPPRHHRYVNLQFLSRVVRADRKSTLPEDLGFLVKHGLMKPNNPRAPTAWATLDEVAEQVCASKPPTPGLRIDAQLRVEIIERLRIEFHSAISRGIYPLGEEEDWQAFVAYTSRASKNRGTGPGLCEQCGCLESSHYILAVCSCECVVDSKSRLEWPEGSCPRCGHRKESHWVQPNLVGPCGCGGCSDPTWAVAEARRQRRTQPTREPK